MDVVAAKPRFPTLNLVLFVATAATTILAGDQIARGPLVPRAASLLAVIRSGLPFAAALLGILLAHEMGHYVLARRWRVDCSLPFFIPVPKLGIGTFGAVIKMRSPI